MTSIDSIEPKPVKLSLWLVTETVGLSQRHTLHLTQKAAEAEVRFRIHDYTLKYYPKRSVKKHLFDELLQDPTKFSELLTTFHRYTKNSVLYSVVAIFTELS